MRRLFSQHGHVVAHFVKDDYVLFIYSSMDDAEKAQRALNFSVIHGKTILVKPASPAEMAMIMDCKKSAPPPQSFFGAQQMYLNGCSNEPQQQHAQQQHAQQHHVQQQQQQQPSPNTNGWMNNNMMPNNSNKWSFDNKPSNSGSIGNVLWAMGSNDRDPSNSASLQNLLPGDLLGESS